jgi:glycerophosphoryl diester phosphodiesterase
MGHAPENTVLSVQKALALDVDRIITDFPDRARGK